MPGARGHRRTRRKHISDEDMARGQRRKRSLAILSGRLPKGKPAPQRRTKKRSATRGRYA